MRSYKVQWDSGVLETVSARSIRREVGVAAWTPPDLAREARQEEGDTGVGEADSSSDMSISSSSSDEESVSTASSTVAVGGGDSELPRAEIEDDGSVLLIHSFTEQRKRVISPGAVLCVDECMSSWQGSEEKYTHDGIPHLTKIQRKPEGVSAELKSIGDGDTGSLLGLEIMEGAQRQRQKAYNAEFGEGTAVVLRLAQPYAGSGRTVVADSAFASVKTLVQLNSMLGLYFMGMVKTATKEYPMAYLKSWSSISRPRDSHTVMESSCSNGSKMYALCWNDRKPKPMISNHTTGF
ncbi:unnamed protein product [Phytophthora lilii]|uniref:Unnamed protein product n=1 Tax=Phytophthora lilii TaxID=2077276 RepID=A0A9W6TQG6_9STRA|nr:unnamed protein product [Phytophthora lilii]